jgi:hypothetical protein
MSYCPNCKTSYIEGIKNCADCGAELIEGEIPLKNEAETTEEMEIVYTCGKVYEAEMVKANLEGAGIEAFVLSQDDSSFPSDGDLSVAKVMVRASNAKEAIEFIESAKNSDIKKEEETE